MENKNTILNYRDSQNFIIKEKNKEGDSYQLYSNGKIEKGLQISHKDGNIRITDYIDSEKYRITNINKENLQLLNQYHLKNGKLHGKNTSWYPSGKIKMEEKYYGGKKIGGQQYNYKNGNSRYVEYRNRKQHGRDELYDKNGKIIEQSMYKDGVRQNYISEKYLIEEKGILNVKGKNNESYSGFSIKNHSNGQKASIIEYSNGKPTGDYIIFAIDGKTEIDKVFTEKNKSKNLSQKKEKIISTNKIDLNTWHHVSKKAEIGEMLNMNDGMYPGIVQLTDTDQMALKIDKRLKSTNNKEIFELDGVKGKLKNNLFTTDIESYKQFTAESSFMLKSLAEDLNLLSKDAINQLNISSNFSFFSNHNKQNNMDKNIMKLKTNQLSFKI